MVRFFYQTISYFVLTKQVDRYFGGSEEENFIHFLRIEKKNETKQKEYLFTKFSF